MPRFLSILLPVILIAILAIEGPDGERWEQGHPAEQFAEKGAAGKEGSTDRKVAGSRCRTSSRLVLEELEAHLLADLTPGERAELAQYLEVLDQRNGAGLSWCWGEGVSEAKVAAFVAAERLAKDRSGGGLTPSALRFLDAGRWDETATDGADAGGQGDPVILTWSVVPDGTPVPGTSGNANQGSDLRSWLAGIYGGSSSGAVEEQPWFGIFEEAFAAMGETCGVVFRFEAGDDGAPVGSGISGVTGARGDIRIGARPLDGNGGLLGISLGPDEGDMVLDSGDALLALTGDDSLRLFNTLTHEIGHCLGLAHVCPVDQTKLMEPNLSTLFRGPQFDEFQSLQRLYGDRLERRGDFRDNDSILTATPLDLAPGSSLSFPRLSIDDNRDEDCFRLDLLNGQRLQVAVVPGEGAYLEGGESSQGCSPGGLFDSASVHDLKVEIFDRDGETVLETADRFGPGGLEETGSFEVPRNGQYFVKVSGGTTDAAQLYELRLQLEEQLPGPRLVLGEAGVIDESDLIKNGRPDPGETVRVQVPLTNEGLDGSGLLSLAVNVSENVTLFSRRVSSGLSAGQSGLVDLIFGVTGVCGDQATLELAVSNDAGVLISKEVVFDLGEILSPMPLVEEFDAGSSLPDAWETSALGSGPIWSTSTARWVTPLRSAFAAGSGAGGESLLVSPPVVIGSKGGKLEFRHFYRTEVGYDGGVLEVSRDGADWVDPITELNLSVEGGYDRTISGGFGSSIGGRPAWTGRLNSFITSSVVLPASWSGESVRFRWRFVHDQSGASAGWWVDSVRFEMEVDDCEPHRPELTLGVVSGGLDENYPTREVTLRLQSALPLLKDVLVPFESVGSAGRDDVSGDFAVTLPAGSLEVNFSLKVVADEQGEGEERLILRIPAGHSAFAPADLAAVDLPVIDRTNLELWSTMQFGRPVDLAGDQDGDGLSGLGEYLLGTNPVSPFSRKGLVPVLGVDGVLLPTGPLPVRVDAVLSVEESGDLVDWQPVSFVLVNEGILVPTNSGGAFVRLTFRRIE